MEKEEFKKSEISIFDHDSIKVEEEKKKDSAIDIGKISDLFVSNEVLKAEEEEPKSEDKSYDVPNYMEIASDIERKLEIATDKLTEANNKIITLTVENKHLKDYAEMSKADNEELRHQNEDLANQFTDLQNSYNDKQTDFDNMFAELERCRQEKTVLESDKEILESKNEELKKRIDSTTADYNAAMQEMTNKNKDAVDGLSIYRDALIRLCRDVR